MGTQVSLPQRGTAPNFLAHICCGQMARWIKMPLRRKVGLDPSDIVLDGEPVPPPQEGCRAPTFRPMLWPNGWMDQDAAWYEGKPRSRLHCVTWGPSSPSQKGQAPQFSAHVYCDQTVTISGTAEHLCCMPESGVDP